MMRGAVLEIDTKTAVRYPILPYPKGDNSPDYVLGTFIQPTIISTETGETVTEIHTENEQISIWGEQR